MILTSGVGGLACAEMFFKCDETLPGDGSGAMVDSITGAVFSPYESAIVEGKVGNFSLTNVSGLSNAVYPQCDLPVKVLRGLLPNFKQRSVILFACGRIVDSSKVRIPIGNGSGDMGFPTATGGDLSLSFVGGMHTIANGATAQLADVSDTARVLPASGTDIGLIVEYTPGVSLTAKAVDLNGATFGSGATETILTDSTVTLADVNPSLNNMTRFGGLAYYSISAFSFDAGLPANRESVYKWMLYQHPLGNRILPPAWSELASTR